MARYFLRYRHSDTGLTPTFAFFKKASDLSVVTPPAVGEVGAGTYYFDYSPTFDIVFEVDGGVSIPTEEVRYISDTISPKDTYVDEPTSQVKDDVWNDVVDRAGGTKGEYVETIGLPADNSAQATLFGKTLLYKESVRGDTAGTSDGNDVEQVYDRAGMPVGADLSADIAAVKTVVDAINIETNAADIANAVWDATTAGNIGVGTMGELLDNAAAGTAPSAATVAAAVWDEASAGHVTAGTFGKLEADTKTAVDAINVETDAASIATAVWDRTLASHTTAGTFGQTLQLADSGAAQAAAAGSITLKAGASSVTDFYKNGLIVITSGTGIAQSRSITAYDGATKIALVDRNWGTTPVAADGYMVLPAAPSSSLTNAGIADAVWDEALAGHLTAGSTGNKLDSGSGGGGVSFLSNGDTVNPIVVQVSSPKHTQVKVTYSEPVVMTGAANGALNLANYTIPGLTLLGITSITSQQVLITTSAQTPNFLYSLVISSVEDLVGNPIL